MSDIPDVGVLPDDGMGSDLAVLAARIADENKATDIIVLDVGEVLAITGYFVVASASNRRLARMVVESIEHAAKERLARSPVRIEGLREQQWILVDYGDVVVHVFVDELREFYEIERLYRDSTRLAWQIPAATDR
ncbi:MAG: ribosome silencing factor [Acidimicrobiia bacterium]|nr:ribosome silencing factor [Acidimicrobiia bacterium]